MTRLLVVVEGQTEETFVADVLREHLGYRGFHSVSARLMGNVRQRAGRGGVKPWQAVRKEIVGLLKEDAQVVVGLMVDYYGMPSSGDGQWPGRARAATLPLAKRGVAVATAIAKDVTAQMGGSFDAKRFLPCVVMHEFEALLFSDCDILASAMTKPALAGAIRAIRDEFPTPEAINDSPVTAPSKRLIGLYPGYDKRLHGVLAAKAMTLPRIADECPQFATWLAGLEALA